MPRDRPGIGVSASVPAPVVHVLLSLDGQRPPGGVIDRAAAAEHGVQAPALRAQAVEMARRRLELGFATAAAGPSGETGVRRYSRSQRTMCG